MNRRGFIAALAGLPFVGKLIQKADDVQVELDEHPLITVTECVPGSSSRFNHDWRCGGEVYRRHLGFEEIEFLTCPRCRLTIRVAPPHRETMPWSYWIHGCDGKPSQVYRSGYTLGTRLED